MSFFYLHILFLTILHAYLIIPSGILICRLGTTAQPGFEFHVICFICFPHFVMFCLQCFMLQSFPGLSNLDRTYLVKQRINTY